MEIKIFICNFEKKNIKKENKMRKKEDKFTLHGKYNMETKKPYVEIKKNGEHYCYSPYSIWKNVAERSY